MPINITWNPRTKRARIERDLLLLGQDTKCDHGAEKGYCLVDGCPADGSAEDCDICGGVHTAEFIKRNLDCRADYPVRGIS